MHLGNAAGRNFASNSDSRARVPARSARLVWQAEHHSPPRSWRKQPVFRTSSADGRLLGACLSSALRCFSTVRSGARFTGSASHPTPASQRALAQAPHPAGERPYFTRIKEGCEKYSSAKDAVSMSRLHDWPVPGGTCQSNLVVSGVYDRSDWPDRHRTPPRQTR